jgi:hypothetical protein
VFEDEEINTPPLFAEMADHACFKLQLREDDAATSSNHVSHSIYDGDLGALV